MRRQKTLPRLPPADDTIDDYERALAEIFADLPADAQAAILAELDMLTLQTIHERRCHRWYARGKQLPPGDDWGSWVVHAGPGFGKTFAGAGWVHERAMAEKPGSPSSGRCPRPVAVLLEIERRPSSVVVVGHSEENRANLDESYYLETIEPLVGTRLYRQEVAAEILVDVEGTLFHRPLIDQHRVKPTRR